METPSSSPVKKPSQSSVGALIVGILLLAIGFSGYVFFWPEYQNRQLLKHGVAGEGVIVEIHPTGNLYNDQPQVRVKIRVSASSTDPFEAETKMIINPVYLPQFQPGRMVRVKFDPRDHSKVAVE
mgnify:CR=1 FL=1